MTWSVLVACSLPVEVEKLFSDRFDVVAVRNGAEGAPSALLHAGLGQFDALVIAPPTRIDAGLLDGASARLKVVATYSVGYEHIDLEVAALRSLAVLHTPDALTDAVAETGMLLLLGAARRATESIDLIRSRKWKGWRPTQLLGRELSGRTLGIVGMGRIGRGIARRAKAFGMSIHYHNRRTLATELEDGAIHHDTIENLLAVSDAVVLACPLTTETRGILNAQRLRLLKESAIVVNVGRGDLVVDDDLIASLRAGRIFAAGLDVFSNEPRVDPRYFDLPNVLMLPHIGSSTMEARLKMGQSLADDLQAIAAGGVPVNRIV